jgi:hypothetical protein
MATKKKVPPAPTTNGEPVPAPAEKEPKPSRMTKLQLQRRIRALEAQVARLTKELEEARGPEVPWWQRIVGSHADAPEAFEEAMRLGREWRESFRPKLRPSGKAVTAPEGDERT